MRIWLDDRRPMPEGYTHHALTGGEAINLIRTHKVEHISLDHDLGLDDELTGYDIACYIEYQVRMGLMPMPTWQCHSMNPVGKNKIEIAMAAAEKEYHAKRT